MITPFFIYFLGCFIFSLFKHFKCFHFRSQFGHRNAPTEVHATRNKVHEGSSKTKKRSRSNANAMASQASEGWVNPKTCATIPRDAGKRRVRADSRSAGHWFTGQDGRKVTSNNEYFCISDL